MNCEIIKSYLKKILPKNIVYVSKNILYAFRWCIFEYEIWKRSKVDIFEYKKLSQDMNLCTREYGHNAFYGISDIIKKELGIRKNKVLQGSIEHGFAYVNSIGEVDSKPDIIYAFGEKRKEFLKGVFPEKNIYCLSPYIQYVESYYNVEKINKIKNKFGKTLLVMPSHSVPQGKIKFNQEEFINMIELLKDKYNYKTIIVCLYWSDVLYGHDTQYIKMGYKICTAGHMFDRNFLPRLKSIILLSDMVVGNDIGTNIGYCICLNRPFYLSYNKVEIDWHAPNKVAKLILEKDVNFQRLLEVKLLELFGEYRENISKEQIEFVKEYWGDWKYNETK